MFARARFNRPAEGRQNGSPSLARQGEASEETYDFSKSLDVSKKGEEPKVFPVPRSFLD